jgi:hypothetical protein
VEIFQKVRCCPVKVVWSLVVAVLISLHVASVEGQINLQEPTGAFPASSQDVIKMVFTLSAPYAAAGKIRIKVNGPLDAVTSKEINPSGSGEFALSVNLFEGANTITVVGFNGAVPSGLQTWNISCQGRWCKAPFSLTADSVVAALGVAAVAPASVPSNVKIESPLDNVTFDNETFMVSQ